MSNYWGGLHQNKKKSAKIMTERFTVKSCDTYNLKWSTVTWRPLPERTFQGLDFRQFPPLITHMMPTRSIYALLPSTNPFVHITKKRLLPLQVTKGVRKGVGFGGLKPPLSLIFYKNFITCAKEIKCFAKFLFINLLTYCKYHGMNMHANFKEHCKWAKK